MFETKRVFWVELIRTSQENQFEIYATSSLPPPPPPHQICCCTIYDFSISCILYFIYLFVLGDVGGISKHLVQLAKSRFSRDNIAVVVVFLSEPEPYKGYRMEASEVEHIWREPYVTKTSNGQFNHDDDFGPETDVDGVHDVLTSAYPADAAKAKALVAQSEAMEGEPKLDPFHFLYFFLFH